MSRRDFWTILLTILTIGFTTCELSANDKVDGVFLELEALVKKELKPLFEKQGIVKIGIGAFPGGAGVLGNSSPEIQEKLQRALEKEKFVVDAFEFQASVKGDYEPHKEPDSNLQAIRLNVTVTQADGTVLGQFVRYVYGSETVPRLLGLTVTTSAAADVREQSKAIEEARRRQAKSEPQGVIDGARISAATGSPFAIELLVKSSGKYVSRAATFNDRGLPFVLIKKDEVYGIRLINNADFEAAVSLTIDGLSVFHFSESAVRPDFWLVPKRGSIDVLGWEKNDEKVFEFQVADFPETAAAKAKVFLKPDPRIGTIVAAFSAAWESDSQRPSDEPNSNGSRGTKLGDEITFKSKSVPRNIGQPRAVIAVRYER